MAATLVLEMGILGEKPQDPECAWRRPFNHFVSI
jgi:hypothetical protein